MVKIYLLLLIFHSTNSKFTDCQHALLGYYDSITVSLDTVTSSNFHSRLQGHRTGAKLLQVNPWLLEEPRRPRTIFSLVPQHGPGLVNSEDPLHPEYNISRHTNSFVDFLWRLAHDRRIFRYVPYFICLSLYLVDGQRVTLARKIRS